MTIRFEGIEKTYMVYARPQDRLWEWITRRQRHHVHVALTGVDFEVRAGETFGLIGENGAGKSTLLKIAAGTIRPTHGRVTQHGRVAALLELGAGFHPEESGYDNIRFMAALHGLQGSAMENFIERSTRFSELTRPTLERPVKTYSSGMFMRLAFAAATAIDPDVLIVDEALSVGDLHFQKKSLNRILELRERGATVLFCSHNLYQVRSLCQRAAWVHGGQVRAIGATEDVVTAYEAHERRRYASSSSLDASAKGGQSLERPASPTESTAPVKIVRLCTESADGINPAQVDSFQDLTLEIEVEAYSDAPFHVGFAIVRPDKDNVFGSSTQFRGSGRPVMQGIGPHVVRVRFPRLPLLSGEYLWNVYTLDDTGLQVLDMAELVQPFTVLNQKHREFGLVWLEHEWLSAA